MSSSQQFIDLSNYKVLNLLIERSQSTIFTAIDNKNGEKCHAEISTQTILYDKVTKQELDSAYQRMSILTSLKHRFLIDIIGYSLKDFEGLDKPTIITKATQGCRFIDEVYPMISENDKSKLIIIFGIAFVMSFLHHHGVVHGDLNLNNIMFDENLFPIITFSFFKTVFTFFSKSFQNFEMISNDPKLQSDDVYAFSLIIYFLYTGQQEINERSNELFQNQNKFCYQLFERCHSKNSEERPSFEEILENLNEKIKPIKKTDSSSQFNEIIEILQKNSETIELNDAELNELNDFYNQVTSENDMDSRTDTDNHFEEDDKNFVICSVCKMKFNRKDNVFRVAPNMYFCREDFEKYRNSREPLPPQILNEYCEKTIQNSLNELLNPFILSDDDLNLIQKHENEIFIDSDIISNSHQLNKDYKCFFPHVTFKFEKSTTEIDFKEIVKNLPKEMVIICIEKGSTFLTIAFILSNEFSETEKEYQKIVDEIKKKLESLIGSPITGNIQDDPKIQFPTEKDLKNFYSKEYINILQNTEILEKIDFNKIRTEFQKKLECIKNKDFELIFSHFDLYEECEKKVREDIKNNEFEFIITNQTIIGNKYLIDYENKKQLFQPDEITECFLYHGSPLKNHRRIIDENFYIPTFEENEMKEDKGFFGIGTYATDNIFYAAYYSTKPNKILDYNEKGSVFCCRAFYNKEKSFDIPFYSSYYNKPPSYDDLPYYGQVIDSEILENCGVHKAFVGYLRKFHQIDINDKKKNYISANEYVFGNNFQIIAVSSFTIMRMDHFILWIDDENNEQNDKQFIELKKLININIYKENSIQNAMLFLDLKKKNKLKLIISVSSLKSAAELIISAQSKFGSNLLCLIYTKNRDFSQFSIEKENILYANDFIYLKDFAEVKLNEDEIEKLAEKLNEEYKIDFNINKDKLKKLCKI